jgi:hypothetical protein
MIHSPPLLLLGAVGIDTALLVFNVVVYALAFLGLAALVAVAMVGISTIRQGIAMSRHEARTRGRRRVAPVDAYAPAPTMPLPVAAPVAPSPAPAVVVEASPAIDPGIAPEIIAILSAAVVAVCGPSAQIRQISLVRNEAATSSWTERGRSRIHQSHRLLRGHR